MFMCSTKRAWIGGCHLKSSFMGCQGKYFKSPNLLKTFSTSTGNLSAKAIKPLKQWTFVVNPFTKVRAQLSCNISIRPLDPHKFPEANRAFITVHGTNADQGVKLDNFHVHYNDQNKELSITADKVNNNVSVELTAPIKCDLFINVRGDGNVRVQKMDGDTCRVQTDYGNCVLHSVKGHHVQVRSLGGNITGVGTIHGNVEISTFGNSAVDVKKVQGTIMNISTEHGPLKVKAIYAESTSVSSASGRIQLGHVHGNATVKNVSGDIIVDGSNGYLKVLSLSGNIDAYVGDDGQAELHSQEGTVCVRVPNTIKAGVQLCGTSVEISPEITLNKAESHSTNGQTTVTGYLNSETQGDQWIKGQTDKGSIKIKTQSWFESLKLAS